MAYGIGKFQSAEDEALYLESLDGTCETCGNVDGIGHFSLVGEAIVMEDDRGFISVSRYKDADEAESHFRSLEEDADDHERGLL